MGCLVDMFKHIFLVFKQYYTHFHTLFHLYVFSHMFSIIGMAMEWGGAEGQGLRPRLLWFCLASFLSRMTRKTLSPHPHPLGPRRPHPIKLYFLLICPTTSTIFFMKPISLIKIYLKLQLNLSNQIKSIFRKN